MLELGRDLALLCLGDRTWATEYLRKGAGPRDRDANEHQRSGGSVADPIDEAEQAADRHCRP